MASGSWALGIDGEPSWSQSQRGYIEGQVTRQGRRVRVLQHRWLMERHLGRSLAQGEDVHHLNEDKTDNRMENLLVLSHSDHQWCHWGTRVSDALDTVWKVRQSLERRKMPAKERDEQLAFWKRIGPLILRARDGRGLTTMGPLPPL